MIKEQYEPNYTDYEELQRQLWTKKGRLIRELAQIDKKLLDIEEVLKQREIKKEIKNE